MSDNNLNIHTPQTGNVSSTEGTLPSTQNVEELQKALGSTVDGQSPQVESSNKSIKTGFLSRIFAPKSPSKSSLPENSPMQNTQTEKTGFITSVKKMFVSILRSLQTISFSTEKHSSPKPEPTLSTEESSSIDRNSSTSRDSLTAIRDTSAFISPSLNLLSAPTQAEAEPSKREEFYSFQHSQFPVIQISPAQREALGASKDQGGHGGTLKGPLEIRGETRQVFLKPFDGVEAKNYEKILEGTNLAKFMPKIHGVTEIDGKHFLVMENTRSDAQGTELQQYGDIKIAGRVKALKGKNPICDQEEMVATRGKEKGFFDYTQMGAGAKLAGDFMFYKNHSMLGSKGRILNFASSEKNLRQALQKANPTADTLRKLAGQIEELKNELKNSGIALIGGSVIILDDGKGGLTPKLIDPAHVQYNPKMKDDFGGNPNLYFGTEEKFEAQQISNEVGLASLRRAILIFADEKSKTTN